MTRHLLFLVSVSLLMISSGCTTPSKSSKLTYLKEGGLLSEKIKSKDIRKDLVRSTQLKKGGEEKKNSASQIKFTSMTTQTRVEIYPYTAPLIRKVVQETIEDQGFKEKWSKEKIEATALKTSNQRIKDLVTGGQCFSVQLETPDRAATELKYWYGHIEQEGQKIKVTFSKGRGFTEVERTTFMSGVGGVYSGSTYDTATHFLFAEACASQKIDLTKEFSLALEPRFKKGILPTRLTWKAPKK